jgi:hypothetical protein
MRKSETSLHLLIHRLTKSEKRYFKVTCAQHQKEEDSSYFHLFDLIEKQKKYDEHQIRQSIKGKIFATNFSQAKADLFQLILKSLRQYHHDKYHSIYLNDQFSDFEILFTRGLFSEADNVLKKARKSKIVSDSAIEEFKTNTYSFRNAVRSNKTNLLKQLDTHYFNEQSKLLKIMQDEIVIQDCFIKIYTILRNIGILHSNNSKLELDALVQPLLQFKLIPHTRVEIRYWYWMSYVFYHYVRSEGSKSIKAVEKVLDMYEKYDRKDMVVLDNISVITSNLLHMEVEAGHTDKATTLYYRLMDLWEKYPVIRSETKSYRVLSSLIGLYVSQGNFKQATQLHEQNVDNINLNTADQQALISLFLKIIWLYILNKQPENARKYIRYLVDQVYTHSASDFLLASRIVAMAIMIDENNLSVLQPFAKASERIFSKFKKMDPSMTSVLNFFKGYRKSLNGKNERQLFQELKHSLMNLPDRKNLLIYKFPYLQVWIESKISNKSISNLLSANVISKSWY